MDSLSWQSFLKSCLDILRNGDSKYDGLKAINEFITLITLKLVENRICESDDSMEESDNYIRIGDDCKFTNLYNTYCTGKNTAELGRKARGLYDILYSVDRIWHVENSFENDDINKHSGQIKTRNNEKECVMVRFNRYTENLSKLTKNSENFRLITSFTRDHYLDVQKIVIKIQETFKDIDMDHFTYDAFGDAYEKMLADELGNGSKRNGQFFTKRDLIKLIVDELAIKSTDICYDPACGTGGFIMGFLSKFKQNKKFIKNNVFGQEYLTDVYKTLNFNMLANNCDTALENLSRGDSIRNESYHTKTKEKFDVVGANPPFGLSIEVMPKEYPLQVKNSVCCFLQHIYFSLKVGGRAGVVIDRGILNNGSDKKNSWEGKLRKFLLEHTNIYKIINLPTGIFKHTNFATAVIFFVKGEITENVEFIEGYFVKEDKGKGDKTMYLHESVNVNIKQIKAKNYSLKIEDYTNVVMEVDDGWLKLGDVVEVKRGKTLSKNKIKPGNYPVIGGGVKFSGYHNEYNYIGSNGIFISRVGTAGYVSRYYKQCYITDLIFTIEPIKININYLWYYLKCSQHEIDKFIAKNAAPNISWSQLKNLKIPNLPLDHQNEIVEFLDEVYQTNQIEETIKYLKDVPIFNLLIMKRYDDFLEMMFYQDNIKFVTNEIKSVSRKQNNFVRGLFRKLTYNVETMKLGDVIEIKKYKPVKICNANENGKYPFYNCSILGHLWSDNYLYEDEVLIMNTINGSGKCNIYYNNGPFTVANNIVIFKAKANTNIKYLHMYLLANTKIISKEFQGGDKKYLNMTGFKNNIKIPIPSLKVQEEIVNRIEKLNESSSHYTQYSQILSQELENMIETIQGMTILENTSIVKKQFEDMNHDEQLEYMQTVYEEALIEYDQVFNQDV